MLSEGPNLFTLCLPGLLAIVVVAFLGTWYPTVRDVKPSTSFRRRRGARVALKELERCAEQFPDLRLGQLIVIATGEPEVFNIENEHLAAKLRQVRKHARSEYVRSR